MSLLNSLLAKVGYVKYRNGDSFYKIGSTNFLKGDLMNIALTNPVLFPCIEIRAKALSKVRFYQTDEKGNKIDMQSDVLDLLNNPNNLQSKQDFLKQYEWFKSVFGYVYQKPYYSALNRELPKAIFNLKASLIEFPKNLKSSIVFSKKDIKDYEKQSFKYKELGQDIKKFDLKDVLKFYDITNNLENTTNSPITSPSRIDAILKSVSNIDLSTNAENIVIQTNGRELFYGGVSKGSNLGTNLPMQSDDKSSIQDVIDNTGLGFGRKRAIITNKEVGHKFLHMKPKELGLHEVIINNAELVRTTFEIPSEVYDAFTKNKTYENQKEATIGFYMNTIQPIADDIANTYNSHFNIKNPIKASFEHLPIMQHTEEKKANKILKIAMAYEKL